MEQAGQAKTQRKKLLWKFLYDRFNSIINNEDQAFLAIF